MVRQADSMLTRDEAGTGDNKHIIEQTRGCRIWIVNDGFDDKSEVYIDVQYISNEFDLFPLGQLPRGGLGPTFYAKKNVRQFRVMWTDSFGVTRTFQPVLSSASGGFNSITVGWESGRPKYEAFSYVTSPP